MIAGGFVSAAQRENWYTSPVSIKVNGKISADWDGKSELIPPFWFSLEEWSDIFFSALYLLVSQPGYCNFSILLYSGFC